MKWEPVTDSTPIGEAILARNHDQWTLAKRVFLEWSTLGFTWPPIQKEQRLTWIFANTAGRTLDFTPTEWCRVEHGLR